MEVIFKGKAMLKDRTQKWQVELCIERRGIELTSRVSAKGYLVSFLIIFRVYYYTARLIDQHLPNGDNTNIPLFRPLIWFVYMYTIF